jgi:hypothetical protein
VARVAASIRYFLHVLTAVNVCTICAWFTLKSNLVTLLKNILIISLATLGLPALADTTVQLLSERSLEEGPKVMVLGTPHFANPGRDVVNIDVEDILVPERQEEIRALIEQLAEFRPTHIAVEWLQTDQDRLTELYERYIDGSHELGRGEEEQIGMRLAAHLGHKRIYAVDWNGFPPGELEAYNWLEWGENNDRQDWIAAMRDPDRSGLKVELGERSVTRWLLEVNSEDVLAQGHRRYFNYAMLGDQDHQPGANWLGHWYARNMRIFANLVRLTSDPDDRILVIYGSGHAYLLRQFVLESGAMRLVEPHDILR